MSEYRAIAPSATRGGGPPRSPEGAPPRRRRVTGQVSQLACNECRRTRSKCDGERPHRCGRCAARGLSCIYEPHTKTQKNDLIRELNKAHEREKNLQDMNNNSAVILEIIRNDGHVDEVIRKLRLGESHSTIVEWLRTLDDVRIQIEQSPSFQDSMIDVVQRVERLFAKPEQNTLEPSVAAKWTKVTANTELLRHLFELYFAWVHPHHYLFAEVDMLESFYEGKDTYCSEALVNAVCAMACHLLEPPGSPTQAMEPEDVWEMQMAFVKEARSYIKPHVQMDMLSIQSMAVLSLVEFSHGHGRSAISYLHCASDEAHVAQLPTHGKPLPNMHPQITNVSRWGITTLTVVWKSLTYQSQSYLGPAFNEAELIETTVREHPWQMYRQKDDAMTRTRRPALSALTARHQAKLAQSVMAMVDLFSGQRGLLHARQVLDIYRKFRDWRKTLPDELTVTTINESDQVLPHVCALHILYHATLVQLWAPLLFAKPPLGTSGQSDLYMKMLESARDGMRLVDYLHKKNVTRYSMPSVAFCICHVGETIIRYSDDVNERISALLLCLNVLEINRTGFQVCGPLSQILRTNAQDSGLKLEEFLPNHLRHDEEFDIDAILDCTTRLNFAQPARNMSRWISTDMSSEWQAAWQELQDEEYRSKSKPMRVTDLLNA